MTASAVAPEAPQVSATPAAPPAGSLTRPGRGATWRSLSAAVVLVQVAGTSLLVAGGFFFQDDYLFMTRALRADLLSSDLLWAHWNGHLMPAGMAATWVLTHGFPLQYAAVILCLTILSTAAALLFRAVALRLLGDGRAHVVAVVLYATSMAVLTASVWWAAAINVLPMQMALFVALLLVLGRPSRPRTVGAVAAVAIGLLFFEKSTLIPFVLFAILWAASPVPGAVAAARVVARRWAGLWAALMALLALYTIAYLATAGTDSSAGLVGSPLVVADTLSRGATTLTTGLIGGPLTWVISFEALATPPAWLVVVAAQVLCVGAGVVLWRGPGAGRWLLLSAGYVAASGVLLLVGRPGAAALLSAAPRYYADAIPVIALSAGAALAAAGPRLRVHARWRNAALLVMVNVILLLAVRSSTGVSLWLDANLTRYYVSTAVRSLGETTTPTEVLDTPILDPVLGSLLVDDNRPSALFAAIPTAVRFTSQAPSLTVLGADGDLGEAHVVGTDAIPGPEYQCGWRVAGERAIPLQQRVEGTVLELGYIATAPGSMDVSVGGGPATTVEVVPGLAKTYVAVTGTGSSVSFTGLTPGVELCTDELTFGLPEPGTDNGPGTDNS